MIGLICAMDVELNDILDELDKEEKEIHHGTTFHIGVIGGKKIVAVKSGVGKVNAARITQMMIDIYSPEAIINSGIAGGLGDELSLGDVVVGTEFVQHDFNINAWGYARGSMGIYKDQTDRTKPTIFKSDEVLNAAISKVAGEIGTVWRGMVASGDQFIASLDQKLDIRNEFGAMAVEMEGAAIAQTCELSGIPYAAVRVISDLADGETHMLTDELEKKYAEISASVTLAFLKKL